MNGVSIRELGLARAARDSVLEPHSPDIIPLTGSWPDHELCPGGMAETAT
jgi:hypothetical protein